MTLFVSFGHSKPIKPLKEASLGAAKALFDPPKDTSLKQVQIIA